MNNEQPTIPSLGDWARNGATAKLRDILARCHRDAEISDDGLFRFTLTRTWDSVKGYVVFIGLNPSTADAAIDDPTVRRCVRFAADWGYGGLVIVNLFAFRATQPRDMMAAADPVGESNDYYLVNAARRAGLVVAAWGANGTYTGRDLEVAGLIAEKTRHQLHSLGTTKDGSPKHPLYVPAATRPTLWQTPDRKEERER